jgi:hypothetical protein
MRIRESITRCSSTNRDANGAAALPPMILGDCSVGFVPAQSAVADFAPFGLVVGP